jgi:carotenoid cleavage dioxygenase
MSNQFLEGAFAPVSDEQTLTELTVTGSVPDYLDGRFVRNGPNPAEEVDPATYHWFVGDGMVHGVRLRDGRAEWYRNRWVRSPRAAKALGETPPPRRVRAGMDGIGANTNVIGHAGRTLALIEGGFACVELTEELDTVGPWDFDRTLRGGYTAHPKRDPETGDLHAISYGVTRGSHVQYSVVGPDGRARRTVDIDVPGRPMMHDFSLTESYVVLYDLPITFDVKSVTEMAVPSWLQLPARLVLSSLIGRVRIPDPLTASRLTRGGNIGGLPYRWNPDHPARVGVLPRDAAGDLVRWFDVEPCCVFHPMNAYDDGDSIVLDVVRHPSMFRTEHHGPIEEPPTLDRWTIDLTAGKVREERLDDRPLEFPRVDERLTGRRHRFGYAPAISLDDLDHADTLLKYDLASGGSQVRNFGLGQLAGEFVFVPARPDAAEDEGVLMGFVHGLADDRTKLEILDAQTLDTVAAIELPVRVPVGFHGNWIPA